VSPFSEKHMGKAVNNWEEGEWECVPVKVEFVCHTF